MNSTTTTTTLSLLDEVRAIFRTCKTSSEFSQASDDMARYASQMTGKAAADRYNVATALNEHRHVLNFLRIDDTKHAAEHSKNRDQALRAAGIFGLS